MSANNRIIIDRETFKVYYDPCVDKPSKLNKDDLIGQGKDLEEAVDIAQKYIREELVDGFYLEYGVDFI